MGGKNMNEYNTRKSINQEKSQLINRALVLDLLRQEGICSRATLSQLSGLKQATITNIINEFIACGLVIETGLMSGSKGRRSIGISLTKRDILLYCVSPLIILLCAQVSVSSSMALVMPT